LTEGSTTYPYAFERTGTALGLQERFSDLAAGDETDHSVRLAGRLASIRSQGKAAFADLVDASGRIQLFARQEFLGEQEMKEFTSLGVGDIVGGEGVVVRTRRGELSVRLQSFVLLAPCLKPMPEKWRGMTDVEARHRKRFLDLLVNPDARRPVEARAAANDAVRVFLDERGFMEVETPLLQPVAGGAVARPFITHHNALDIDLYLRVAPELYLKRLLIGGLERVYELNRSFRNEGISGKANPEFTMLEAYEAFVDYEHTMSLVEELVRAVAQAVNGSLQVERGGTSIDLAAPFRRVTMFEAIAESGGPVLQEVWLERDWDELRARAGSFVDHLDPEWPPGKVLMELFEATAEKTTLQPTFVAGVPKDVSPLAKDHRHIPGFTEHSDLVIGGLEIAPVYSELNDPEEQRRRFEQQASARTAGDEEAALPDEEFLEALAYGMPPAGGFGLGMDRLLTVLLGAGSLREVILFPTLRPEG
jgi:lysyl-tRNA synthetase, class II